MNPPAALFTAAGRGIGAAASGKLAGKGWAVEILSPSGCGTARTQDDPGVTSSSLEAANPHAADELAELVTFLSSDQLSHITSQNIRSHGGLIRSV